MAPSGTACGELRALSITAASKAFRTAGRSAIALDGVALDVRAGERVALLGRNGAGKSTLIKSVGSLVALDHGEIRVAGEPVSRSPRYLRNVGFTLEGSRNVYWRHTPYENVRYFARLRGARVDAAHIDRLLDQFEIPMARTKEVGELSTGNRQKVAIVCAIAHDPALLLLDEPTLGLDIEAVANIKRLVTGGAGRADRAFVITSHDLSFVADVCERVVVLDAGRVVYDGPLSLLCARASGYEVKITLDAGDASAIPQRWADVARAEVARVDGKLSVSFRAESPEGIFQAFAQLDVDRGAPRVVDLDVRKAGLEAAYVGLAPRARA